MQMLNKISPTLQALQEQINGLALAVQSKRSPSPAPPAASPIYQAPPTPRYQEPPQKHFQAPFQPPYQQQGQWTHNGQGRGRMSKRGRGRGRGRGRCMQNNHFRQHQLGPQYGKHQYYGQQQQQFRNPSALTPPNQIKHFKNMNYCHSCGYEVAYCHTISTCPYQKPNHNCNATRADTCGGSNKGIHKTQWT